jgi:nitrate reductase molybdenum cofactor assembly chaperone NarJ/NarW
VNRQTRILRQAASWCLRYPDEQVRAALPVVAQAVAELRADPATEHLRRFLTYADSTPAIDLAAHYVTVFDLRNRRSLNLTWWSDGDTRRRGMALVAFGEAYRSAGWEFGGDDLADYLPALLEFAALDDRAAQQAGEQLLATHRDGIDALHRALAAADTPYLHVLDALSTTLPPRSARDRSAGPERPLLELVGLDAYPTHVVEAAR